MDAERMDGRCHNSGYGLHSKFDIQKHKATFVGYLEVIIDENGTVMYAVPSHQEKALALAEEKLGKTRKEISDMCPREFYFDYLNWLLSLTGAIAVWNDDVSAPAITVKQAAVLRALKLNGLYKGKIPKIMPQDL